MLTRNLDISIDEKLPTITNMTSINYMYITKKTSDLAGIIANLSLMKKVTTLQRYTRISPIAIFMKNNCYIENPINGKDKKIIPPLEF